LIRLGFEERIRAHISPAVSLPAIGQGAIGAGAYGASKGIGALKERYGVASGKDAITVGAADAAQRVKAAAGPMVDKLKGQVAEAGQSARTAMAPMADKLKGQAAQVGQMVKRKYAAGGKAVARGMKSGRGMGSVAQRAVRAVIHAQVGPNGPSLVALEAKLDTAIAQHEFSNLKIKGLSPEEEARMDALWYASAGYLAGKHRNKIKAVGKRVTQAVGRRLGAAV
jgi:hypothetical protein